MVVKNLYNATIYSSRFRFFMLQYDWMSEKIKMQMTQLLNAKNITINTIETQWKFIVQAVII